MDEGGPLAVQPLFTVHRERSLFQTRVTRRILPVAGGGLVLFSLAVALVLTLGPTTAEHIVSARELVAAGRYDEAERLLRSLDTDDADEISERQRLFALIRKHLRADLAGRREDMALANARRARDEGDFAMAARAIEEAGSGHAALRREIGQALVRQAEREASKWNADEAERLLDLARKALVSSPGIDAAEMSAAEARRQQEELTDLLAAAAAAEAEGDLSRAEALLARARELDGPPELTAEARSRYETVHGRAEELKNRETVLAEVRALLDKGRLAEARRLLDRYEKKTGDTSLSVHADALQKLEKQGGVKSYLPVRRALRWLAAHQGPDGGMHNKTFHLICKFPGCRGGGTARYDAGLTGLTLMAFTAFTELDVLEEFREPAEKAAKYLMPLVGKSGRMTGVTGVSGTYTEAITAVALIERSQVVEDPKAEIATATRLIAYLRDVTHLEDGGWRYHAKSNASDVSVTCWVAQALHAAKSNGIDVPVATIDRAVRFLDYLTNADGRTSYMVNTGRQQTMTPAGLLAKLLLGEDRASPLLQASASYVARYQPTNYLRKGGRRSGPAERDAARLYTGAPGFYLWYYQTYSLRMVGGKRWKIFGPSIEKTLLATQETAGHALGSWDPVIGWSRNVGRIYATAMATLTLEVYYRSKAGLSLAAKKGEKPELPGTR